MQYSGKNCGVCGERILTQIEGSGCRICDVAFHKDCLSDSDQCPHCQESFRILETTEERPTRLQRATTILDVLLIALALLIAYSNFLSGYHPSKGKFFVMLLMIPGIIIACVIPVSVIIQVVRKKSFSRLSILSYIIFYLGLATIFLLPLLGQHLAFWRAGLDNVRVEADALMEGCDEEYVLHHKKDFPEHIKKLNAFRVLVSKDKVIIVRDGWVSKKWGIQVISPQSTHPSNRKMFDDRVFEYRTP